MYICESPIAYSYSALCCNYKRYSYSQPSQDIKPKRELRRFAPQLSFGFWLCLNIDGYSYSLVMGLFMPILFFSYHFPLYIFKLLNSLQIPFNFKTKLTIFRISI
ncbi:hypothetical protein B9G53_00450 [Pseudanabaena sp. SR411]|nr:hypothetical protein B9G53_00450 [Pseudanabaena sp. SR411]